MTHEQEYSQSLIKWVKNHYWDSLQKDKNLILRHLRTFTGDEELCTWTETEDCWETSCGEAFIICEGTPKENNMKFCPYCGRRIKEGNVLIKSIIDNNKQNDVNKSIEDRIDRIIIPETWRKGKFYPPNIACKQSAKKICKNLFNDYGLIASEITATIEEGIFIKFFNKNNSKVLKIEVYNNLQIAAIVVKEKNIIDSEDIKNYNFKKIIETFYG